MKKERIRSNSTLRRARALRRNMLMMVSALILGVVLSVCCFTLGTNAMNQAEAQPVYKYYTSIEVRYGDSLWSIAKDYYCEQYKDYNAYIAEVMQINSLHTEEIIAGNHLIVPYYSDILK